MVFANTGGRVLGFDFDAVGHLIAADAIKGLLAISPDRKITVLADEVGGDPIRYADAVVVASTGKVYFSMRGLDGKIWLGFFGPRSPDVDAMADKPFLRELTLRLPRVLWPLPKAYGHVLAFTEDGKVVADLQDPTGAYPETTGLTKTADRLYVQNLHLKVLDWLAR